MKIHHGFLAVIVLGIAALACSIPRTDPTAEAITVQTTTTDVVVVTETPLADPTSLPTAIPEVQIDEADRAFFNGDWDLALVEYQKALDTALDSDVQAAALLGLGRSYYALGRYQESLDALEALTQAFSGSSLQAPGTYTMARVLSALSRFDEASKAYAHYLELRPGLIDSYIHEWRGDALASAGSYLDAIDSYQAAMNAPRLDEPLGIQVKMANTYTVLGDHDTALIAYQDVYTRTSNDYTKAHIDYLMGQSYTAIGQMESAYKVYLDAVQKYPRSYDSYQALIILVDMGYPVSEFDRGLVDYFAGQYNLSIAAFDRYLATNAENAGTAYYYKGLAYLAVDNPNAAIEAWDVLIHSYLANDNWDEAWEDKAFTQWAYLDQYDIATQTCLDFVNGYPWHDRASEFLFNAARISERSGDLAQAAKLWERIPSEYPASPLVPSAIFLAGIAHYRADDFSAAMSTFEWALGSSADPVNKSAAYFWIAKTYQVLGDESGAEIFWTNAANEDPTGYYSERARDLLVDRTPFEPPVMFDLGMDIASEQQNAQAWMRSVFMLPEDLDLSSSESLLADARFVRGTELWNLGEYELARLEFESLRGDILDNPADNYRLAVALAELGLYRSAIFAARQVLNLHGMDDSQTMAAPIYFNHLRFGAYYKELVLPIADEFGFHPLFLFSVVRQESLFEGFVHSSAGARGLMQIMPSTGESIAANSGWPPGYSAEDLYRPKVNLILGADYLDSQLDFFDGDWYAALAAYNAGPGNAIVWRDLSGGDIDLFLEIIRFDETRNYIKGIYEVFTIYRRLYDRSP